MAVTAYDLVSFEGVPPTAHLPKHFLDAIKRARSSISVVRDLEEALSYLELWNVVVQEGVSKYGPYDWDCDPRTKVTVSALMRSAIITFCRAIDGGAKGRTALDISSLTANPAYYEAKERIREVRNNGVGHYGPSHPRGYNTSLDRLILVINNEDKMAKTTSPFSRVSSSAAIIDDLGMLITQTQPVAKAWCDAQFEIVRGKIRDLARKGRMDIAKQYPINLENEVCKALLVDPKNGNWFSVESV